MQKLNYRMVLTLISTTLSGFSWADDNGKAVIDKVVSAYGDTRLIQLKSLQLDDQYIGFNLGQSYSPDEIDKTDYRASVAVDLQNQRKSLRWIIGNKENHSTRHWVFDGRNGYHISHDTEAMSQSQSMNFTNVARRHLDNLDTYLAWLLHKNREMASYLGEERIAGKPHHKLQLKIEGQPQLNLFIDRRTGQIRQMRRPYWVEGQDYRHHYSNFTRREGISYSETFYVTRGGQPYSAGVTRKLKVNAEIQEAFRLPTGYVQAPETLDFTDMEVKQLAGDLYLAGQNWGFSIFYDTGDYFIASGGYKGLKARFAAINSMTRGEKPLKYLIVSHHHVDHLGGMKEAVELGASFVTVRSHVDSIRSAAGVNIPDEQFIIVSRKTNLADGKVQVIDFPNRHASHNLISYFSPARTLFSADIFMSRQARGAPDGDEGLKSFKDMLKGESIPVKFFVAAHSARVLTAADLDESIRRIRVTVCPKGWSLCRFALGTGTVRAWRACCALFATSMTGR